MADGSKLFGRVVKMQVKPKVGDIVKIDGFDISFDIEKTLEREPNKAKFMIFNLPINVQSRFQLKDDAELTFEAGYKATSAIVFRGNVTHALPGNEGPDRVLHVEAAEGHKAYRKSYIAKSYGEGTPFKTVVEDIVKSFDNFKVTPAITKTISAIGKTFPSGLTLDGPSAKILTEIVEPLGLAWSFQNNEVQIIKVGGASELPAVRLGYDSGLVGTPQLGEKKGKATITFQSLLQPELVPGRVVLLSYDGKGPKEIVLDTVKPKGSNFDTEFYSYCEAFLP